MSNDVVKRETAKPLMPVTDPADWTGAALKAADDYIYRLTETDIAELDTAIKGVQVKSIAIKDITRDDFPLPTLDTTFAAIHEQLMNGRGLALLNGYTLE